MRLRVCQLLQLIINNQAGSSNPCILVLKAWSNEQLCNYQQHQLASARVQCHYSALKVCMHECVHQADEEAALSDDVAESVLQTMLKRLRDKQPAIRCQAALALARLADPGEVRTSPKPHYALQMHAQNALKTLHYHHIQQQSDV